MTINQIGKPISTPRNYEAFAKEGYQKNVIAYKVISFIAKSTASVSWYLQSKRTKVEIENHPLLDLLASPNPMQGFSSFFEYMISYFEIAGNSYLEAVKPSENKPPMELWPLPPNKMKVVGGQGGMPAGYLFKSNTSEKFWPSDVMGNSDILHLKTFHPNDPWYGMSPIEAAIYGIDSHNEASVWNLALLQNMATPSGALVVKQDDKNPFGRLSDPQFENIKEQLKKKYEGSQNAGRTLLLEGGFEWKQMGFSPKDMEWMNTKSVSAREIALAFGVPPLLLNIASDNTFANFKEARIAYWEDTAIPLLDYVQDEWNRWLVPMFGDDIELKYNPDTIEALNQRRMDKFAILNQVRFLTDNEKRDAVGYEPIEGGDELILRLPSLRDEQPELSQENPQIDVEDEPQDNEEAKDIDAGATQEDQQRFEQSLETMFDLPHLINIKHFEFKNQLEKKNTAVRLYRLREALYKSMQSDLEALFKKQAKQVAESIVSLDQRLAEFSAIQAADLINEEYEQIIKKHLKRSIDFFGIPVLQRGKNHSQTHETKTESRFRQATDRYIDTRAGEAISITETSFKKKLRKELRDLLLEAETNGESLDFVQRGLTEKFAAITPSRAATIARTETHLATSYGSLEAAKSLDIPDLKKEWISVNDDRTRDNPAVADHADMNGKQAELNEKFLVPPDVSMDGPGDPSAPPEQIINCILPNQYVSGYFLAGVQSEYVGTVFEFQTKSGRTLTVTPNHPIATSQGILPACELVDGIDLICDSREVWGNLSGENNVQNKPALIQNVFHSLHVLGNSLTTDLSINDLHGDARFVAGKVKVVLSDRELLNKFTINRLNSGEDFTFISKNMGALGKSGVSSFNFDNITVSGSTSSKPGIFKLPVNESGVLFNKLPFDGLGFGLAPELDAFLYEMSLNSSSINTDFFRNAVNGNTRLVFFDPIVKVRNYNYSGHVYDLQTNNGLMQTNGIITSNCRCVLVYTR